MKPVIDVWNAPFWDAAREGRLLVQRCTDTQQCFFPPAPVSPFTGRPHVEWIESAGRGELFSFVVFHQKYFPGFPTPYTVVMVRLDEGPMLLTNLRGAEASALKIGQRMHVVFDPEVDGFRLPQFEIAA
jgi:hypothetical protein